MKRFEDFIVEKKLEKLALQVKIEIDIESSKHSEERKFRHGTEDQINDEEIISTCELAVEDIAKDFVLDKSNVGDYFHIHHMDTDLNVVCTVFGDKFPLTLRVITVMRKKDFKAKKETRTYYVKN